ncbi:MAG: hypothetical protein ACKE9I_02820 [Methylophagaceae bacterium]
MLQLWRKPTLIAITPDGVTINSGHKARNVITTKKAFTWQQVLTGFENNAVSINAKSVRFILSNQYVRYAVLPWQAGVFSQQDWHSLAENHMRSLYGKAIDKWTIQVAMQGYGKPLVVSAIDRELLVRLDSIATQNNWTIESVEPALMSITNHYRNKINKNDWLMISESQYLLLVEIVNGMVMNFSVTMPPESEISVQARNLLNRALKSPQNSELKQLHIFGDLNFPEGDGRLNINKLSKNTDGTTVDSLLAGLV